MWNYLIRPKKNTHSVTSVIISSVFIHAVLNKRFVLQLLVSDLRRKLESDRYMQILLSIDINSFRHMISPSPDSWLPGRPEHAHLGRYFCAG